MKALRIGLLKTRDFFVVGFTVYLLKFYRFIDLVSYSALMDKSSLKVWNDTGVLLFS